MQCPVDLAPHHEYHKERLLEATKVGDNAVVCVDPNLAKLIARVMGADSLDAEGVFPSSVVGVHRTDAEEFSSDKKEKTVIFIVQSRLRVLSDVVRHVRRLKTQGSKRIYVYVAPRNTLVAEHVFEKQEVKAHIHAVKGLDLDLAVLGPDLLSMELDNTVRELAVESDQSVLDAVAKSVMKLQVFYGPIQKLYRMGSHATGVVETVQAMTSEAKRMKAFQGSASSIHAAFFFDRRVDPVAAVLTPGTYSGQLLEMYPDDFYHTALRMPSTPEWEGETWPAGEGKSTDKMTLDTEDVAWHVLRDVHIKGVDKVWFQEATKLNEKATSTGTELREMAAFLRNKPLWDAQIRMYNNHKKAINRVFDAFATDDAKRRRQFENFALQPDQADKDDEKREVEWLEGQICKKEPMVDVLRCLCVYSHGCGGLKAKTCEALKSMFVQVYGVAYMTHWDRLERSRLLSVAGSSKKDGGSALPDLLRKLNLYETPYAPPFTPHQVLSGYCPVVARIMEKTISGRDWAVSWASLEKYFALLVGDKALCSSVEELDCDVVETGKPRVAVLYFIGGVTYAEVGALRMVQARHNEANPDSPVHFLVATTGIINGDALVRSVTHESQPVPT
eukprot:TRINITY_DN27204_c0_g1_i1.p1 TRINITY_DN27204_c0_g1~~TRINITY_DN27204_c0_g1_i1.p1  ORF type:complete len:616 (+),score=229.24 TRINITY_DN27204_c0_g1_i1:105-1952(+)